MYTLDIIKYISIRPKNKKVLSIITLPVAIETSLAYNCYYYNITNEKHILFLNDSINSSNQTSRHEIWKDGSHIGRNIKCNIHTVFGDVYKGRIMWLIYIGAADISRGIVLDITSDEKMEYKKNYYLRSENSNKRFAMMEI